MYFKYTAPVRRYCFKMPENKTPLLGQHIEEEKFSITANITLIENRQRIRGAVCNFQEMQQFEKSAKDLESFKLLNDQLQAVFQSVSDAVWVCDGHGNVININKASEKMNAIKAENVIGRNVADLIKKGMFDRSVTAQVLEKRKRITIHHP